MPHDGLVSAGDKRPLFVTRFGLSDRTAIGVQTKGLLSHFSDYLHLYWNEGLFDPRYPRSLCLDNWPFARIAALKRKTSIAEGLQRLGISRWNDEKPSPSLRAYLSGFRDEISTVYLAPIDSADARRMKEIACSLDLPFVVHLWDFLDNACDEATHWLIGNAKHVFCLNNEILENVETIQNNASILPFHRLPSDAKASFSIGKTTTIAIMGDIGSYIDGIHRLISAVDLL
jgi:hypothetical protein